MIKRLSLAIVFTTIGLLAGIVLTGRMRANDLAVAQPVTPEPTTAEAQRSDVVITSYSLAHRDKDDFARVNWHRIALDEAQKIKNPAAAATVAIRSLYAPHRVALTGTPIENHLSELWSIMQVLNPGLLGTAADFREKFAVPIEKLGEKDRAHQLRQMIRPFILRRTKADPTIAAHVLAYNAFQGGYEDNLVVTATPIGLAK